MEPTYLTIIQYDSAADQTFLVMNTEQIFGYFENPESGTNAMLGIMTAKQKTTILSKGYSVQTVEENPDMNNYVFYNNAEENMARNLAGIGKIYAITENHTLVQTNGDESTTASVSADFKEIALEDIRPVIAENNAVDLTILNSNTEISPSISTTPKDNALPNYLILPVIIVGILALAIIAYVVWKKLRKDENIIS